jgi:AraC family transcriptional regulator
MPVDLANVEIIDRQPVHVACMRYVGSPGEPLSRFWRDTVSPWMLENGLMGRPRYGVSHGDPSEPAAEEWRYDACVEVDERFKGSGPYQAATVAAGRYAVARFEGTVTEMPLAWGALLHEWLPRSDQTLDSRPFLEYYGPSSSFDPKTGVLTCELCIPVVAR